ncbi:MAG: hypothetical protein HQL87_03730 [Magnetococcales bacterium]|nr:hypothetical protein [Magnetococcales bacterium]
MSATVAFDTHKFILRLRNAGVDEKQAEAFSEAIHDVQDAQFHKLSTKGDIEKLRLELDTQLEKELSPIKTDLAVIKWMLALIIIVVVLLALKTLLGPSIEQGTARSAVVQPAVPHPAP